ncbi:MAG: hypothetical protein KKD28_15825 [Chloroflexi bacterium]|nr:hypothetical protein [Chloroflexota bacterium]MBU1662927.1 hypothetical protein [Chloroflexota bacterium]
MRIHLLTLGLLLVTACTPIATATPLPTPQLITVAITPTLRPWHDILHKCATANPEIALILEEKPETSLEVGAADLILRVGAPPEGIPGSAALLGWEEILIIAHPETKFDNWDIAKLHDIYTASPTPYQIWTYSPGSELRQIFDAAVLNARTSPYAFLAPDPAAMLEAVANDKRAIGYLPKSWLNDAVRPVNVGSDLQNVLRQPILALTDTEPEGVMRAFLVCVQEAQR